MGILYVGACLPLPGPRTRTCLVEHAVPRDRNFEIRQPPARKLAVFTVDADDSDVWADEPIWRNGEVVGFVTSGGYAHYVAESVAIGFVPPSLIGDDQQVEIEILGELRPARVITQPLFDPKAQRMRG